VHVQCAVAGGGPAGMMLGLLLARAGVNVAVLEKHADFLRDFRGDTIHPSTLELLHELGILDAFLARPHQEVRSLTGHVAGEPVTIADFSHLPTRCKFVAMMPQWDFLDFIAAEARRFPTFRLIMQAEVTGLVENGGRIVGVAAKTPQGPLEITADLVVGADGRRSIVRERAGLTVDDFGAPIDVLWMRVSRRRDDPSQLLGYIETGHVFVMFDRGDYWQCAYVIPKGGFEQVQARGLDTFRRSVAAIVPFLSDRVEEIRQWSDVKLLTVVVDRLRQWYRPGLLCIGDAAHAMSPIGGVGINLAVQDAVAAANILSGPLARGACSVSDLARVQKRREFPTRVVQRAQLLAQDLFLKKTLESRAPQKMPLPLKLLQLWPFLRRIPARLVGMGIRPEHIHEHPQSVAGSQ
jgi:2-polyprenyl-6-methoxyphenol hydroxylase-like FAD-dependent oxidoreductase